MKQKAIWKQDDVNHVREFRIHTEIQYCNVFFWESSFVPEVQPTAKEQASPSFTISETSDCIAEHGLRESISMENMK